jgi:hypothetical protein
LIFIQLAALSVAGCLLLVVSTHNSRLLNKFRFQISTCAQFVYSPPTPAGRQRRRVHGGNLIFIQPGDGDWIKPHVGEHGSSVFFEGHWFASQTHFTTFGGHKL